MSREDVIEYCCRCLLMNVEALVDNCIIIYDSINDKIGLKKYIYSDVSKNYIYLPSCIDKICCRAFDYICVDEVIGENVLEVESHAFNYCDIRKCTFPKLSIINNYAFEEFSSLEELELSNHLSYLGKQSFENTSLHNFKTAKIDRASSFIFFNTPLEVFDVKIIKKCYLNTFFGISESVNTQINNNLRIKEFIDVYGNLLSIDGPYNTMHFDSLEKLEDGLKKNQNIPLQIIDMYIDYYRFN